MTQATPPMDLLPTAKGTPAELDTGEMLLNVGPAHQNEPAAAPVGADP